MEKELPPGLRETLERAARSNRMVLVLTGAGISAESGIPTFRGEEGYWKVGSRNYQPEELATRKAFTKMPEEIWAWYLHRRSVCRRAEPNAAHGALVDLETALGDRFALVTQNVDGLHRRAGSSAERLFEIHGNIELTRCSEECTGAGRDALAPLPASISLDWPRGKALGEEEKRLLRCSRCGGWARPHVLWFDEYYDEELFRSRSALALVEEASLLLVVGTSGQTTLPFQIVLRAASRRIPIVVVNLDESPFSEHALATGGADVRGKAAEWLPAICARLS